MQSFAIPQHPVATTDKPFSSLGLSPPILKVIEQIGFQYPTPIQSEVIPLALSGRDLIGLAATGSGKTAAFSLPLAERLSHGKGLRGLILSPTRELALQTKAFMDLFGQDRHLDTACLIGGVRMGPQFEALKRGPDVVVATPGRLLDHIERRTLKLDAIEELVLDEADHMLDLGFLPQVQEILSLLPKQRHTMLFSATMPPPIERLTKMFLSDPLRVDILPEGGAATGLTHRLYMVADEDKKKCLYELLHMNLGRTLIFIRRKSDAEWLTSVLEREGFSVGRIHADLTQAQRVHELKSFRDGKTRILVATGVAGRGIDIPEIEHVIHFDLPEKVDDYIHRAGRTGRGAMTGLVSSIVTWQDKPTIKEVEAVLGFEIPRCTLPGVEPWVELKPKPTIRRRMLR